MAYQHTLSRLLEQSGKRNHAHQVYQRLAALQTTDLYVFYKLGEYARQDGKSLQAIPYYRQAVQLKPAHAGYPQRVATSGGAESEVTVHDRLFDSIP